ncbi:MAG: hypothetical protein P1U68_09225 [Verrucomicrobiales bacterium]|nr:hypothetical protein [Verrucomicrobiales bacterium]
MWSRNIDIKKVKEYLPALLFLLSVSLTGCVPVERFWWSPDGEKAVVTFEGRVHLVCESRRSGEVIAIDDSAAGSAAGSAVWDGVDWFADSSGFVAHRAFPVEQWTDFVSLIPAEEAQQIERISESMPDFLRSTVVLGGDAEKLSVLLDRAIGAPSDSVRNALLLAQERHPDAVIESLSGAPRARKNLGAYVEEIQGYMVHEIVSVALDSDAGMSGFSVLHRSVETLASPQIAPEFPLVAFARISSGSKALVSVEVVSLDGGPTTVCARRVHPAFSWSIDGRSLTTMVPTAGEGILTQIKSIRLLDEEGTWLPDDQRVTSNLVASAMPFKPRVETLPDGDLLLASRSGDFPVVNEGASFEAHLYRFSVEDCTLERIATAPHALPMDLGYFVASPDGKRVAVVESETDAVAVVELSTGETEIISPSHRGWKCRTLPHWRSADEVSFAALSESTNRIEWRMWKKGGETRNLSEGWPAGSTDGWLKLSEEKE